jgi:predicted P-loop ATPase
MIRLKLLAVGAMVVLSSMASAAVYRWVDADGKVHYTDKPVANAEPVNIQTGQPKDAVPLPSSVPAQDTNLTPEQRTQKAADCEQKKKQLATYKDAAKIVETDSLGREHEYSEEEKQQLVKKTQQGMQESCGISAATLSGG